MAASYFSERAYSSTADGVSNSVRSPLSPGAPQAPRTNALTNRISNVLSASYADLDIRDSLDILDKRGLSNTAETRRNLRLDVQEELIKCNGGIVEDFGEVAEVCIQISTCLNILKICSN